MLFIYLVKNIVMGKRKIIELPPEIAPKMKEIGLKVVEYRKPIHVNYREFAKQKGISVMTLWRIQHGEDYKMSSFLEVLKAIGTSPEEFFKGIK
jgi:hypothetical protein